ncbi:MAG: fructose PTS transporter subunit IIA [Propioniciclava sp.]
MNAIISADRVVLDVAATSQAEIFTAIAQRAVDLGIATDADDVVAGLQEREAEGTTGLMDGVAIPHAKRTSITEPAIVVFRTRVPVAWESLDGDPIRLAISLLIPENEAGTTHLKLLSQVARGLMNAEVRTRLVAAPTPAAVVAELGPLVAT